MCIVSSLYCENQIICSFYRKSKFFRKAQQNGLCANIYIAFCSGQTVDHYKEDLKKILNPAQC